MSQVMLFVLVMTMAGLAALAAVLMTRAQIIKMSRTRFAQLESRHVAQIEGLKHQSHAVEAQLYEACRKVADLESQIQHTEQENAWLQEELARRPFIMRKTYKILTVGIRSTGKTSLTLKWANPLTNLHAIEGTKIERYERTVSKAPQKDQKEVVTEHVFEIGDWGGEHIVDAQQELIMEEIHGLLLVVDLGGKDATRVEPERIEEQLRQFQPQALQFFFGPKTVSACKTVVLFINKSDLLPGTPAQVEAEAKRLYSRLINDLTKYATHVDVRVLVGSASYGHSTHHLFAHYVEKILPKSAYDSQLLQRMQDDLAQVPGSMTQVTDESEIVDERASANGTTPIPISFEAGEGGINGSVRPVLEVSRDVAVGGSSNGAGDHHGSSGVGFRVPRPGANGSAAGVFGTQRMSGRQ
jgi:GTPase SAR1 family protein